ncbi:MADS-box protein AGL42-like isoform X1 [Cucumis melo var. makuwa]|uniref:MADS-box protein AGL42-like isoform X1 n=1 Tax=Cucumis melo var. makuwa TaxID=1194695 RepID=A0A5D3DFA2_CUCMM|nr:MADS-box protein AGL42-like isoform X1 [Cucumis melo var. makuwa]
MPKIMDRYRKCTIDAKNNNTKFDRQLQLQQSRLEAESINKKMELMQLSHGCWDMDWIIVPLMNFKYLMLSFNEASSKLGLERSIEHFWHSIGRWWFRSVYPWRRLRPVDYWAKIFFKQGGILFKDAPTADGTVAEGVSLCWVFVVRRYL